MALSGLLLFSTYSKTCTLISINEVSKEMFAQYGHNIDNIPPTRAALLQHIMRAVYQASHIWVQALEPSQELPSPGNWGYKLSSSG